jgi:hypothetical protein
VHVSGRNIQQHAFLARCLIAAERNQRTACSHLLRRFGPWLPNQLGHVHHSTKLRYFIFKTRNPPFSSFLSLHPYALAQTFPTFLYPNTLVYLPSRASHLQLLTILSSLHSAHSTDCLALAIPYPFCLHFRRLNLPPSLSGTVDLNVDQFPSPIHTTLNTIIFTSQATGDSVAARLFDNVTYISTFPSCDYTCNFYKD